MGDTPELLLQYQETQELVRGAIYSLPQALLTEFGLDLLLPELESFSPESSLLPDQENTRKAADLMTAVRDILRGQAMNEVVVNMGQDRQVKKVIGLLIKSISSTEVEGAGLTEDQVKTVLAALLFSLVFEGLSSPETQ